MGWLLATAPRDHLGQTARMTTVEHGAGPRAAGILAGMVLFAAACTTPPATPTATAPSPGASDPTARPTPSGSPQLGVDWQRVYAVEQPPGDPLVTPPPASGSGLSQHPGHYTGGMADLMDVAEGSDVLVAAGFFDEGPRAMVWTSSDGRSWAVAPAFPTGDGSIAYAVASGPDGLVAGGVDGSDAAVWLSADGRTWQRVEQAAFHDDAAPLEIRSLTRTEAGWLAAGFQGGIVHDLRAAFWRSTDGRTWQRVPDQPDFAKGRVEDLAMTPQGVVAVGSLGTYGQSEAGAVWRSTDGETWRREPTDGTFAGAVLRGVTAFGNGIVAVGSTDDDRAARSWVSEDGRSWTPSPADPAIDNHGLKILMRDVAVVDGQLIAGGHMLIGTQYSSAMLWRSTDGLRWERARDVPAFAGGIVEGLASGGPGVVAVGSYGAPDLFIPTVWLSPAWPDA
jgi:hypothetical protein